VRYRRSIAPFVLSLTLLAAPAAADPITYAFKGTITTLGSNIKYFMPEVAIGQSFSAFLEFIPFGGPTQFAKSSLTVKVGKYTLLGEDPMADPFATHWLAFSGHPLGLAQGAFIESMFLTWTTLPGRFGVTISGTRENVSGGLGGTINSVRQVPEPATAVLMLIGVYAVRISQRRLSHPPDTLT
jgi:hypothetical protein